MSKFDEKYAKTIESTMRLSNDFVNCINYELLYKDPEEFLDCLLFKIINGKYFFDFVIENKDIFKEYYTENENIIKMASLLKGIYDKGSITISYNLGKIKEKIINPTKMIYCICKLIKEKYNIFKHYTLKKYTYEDHYFISSDNWYAYKFIFRGYNFNHLLQFEVDLNNNTVMTINKSERPYESFCYRMNKNDLLQRYGKDLEPFPNKYAYMSDDKFCKLTLEFFVSFLFGSNFFYILYNSPINNLISSTFEKDAIISDDFYNLFNKE